MKLPGLWEKGEVFLGSGDSLATASVVLFGAPMDYTASFRPGARLAPAAIRRLSPVLEEYSVAAGRDLTEISFFDAGDMVLPYGNVEKSLKSIKAVVSAIATAGKIPFLLGGDHLVSFPAVQALHCLCPDLVVLHFDAHADLRLHYQGEKLSHASIVYRLLEDVGIKDVYQFGIRSATKEEMLLAADRTNLFLNEVIAPLKKVVDNLKERPLYITVDIDVLDPAFAPGTGTPEPGGITAGEFLRIPEVLSASRVVGLDLVEVSPPYDPAETTSLLAAKFIREALLFLMD